MTSPSKEATTEGTAAPAVAAAAVSTTTTTTTTTTTANKPKKKQWFPLESNPALINSYIQKLGYSTELYEFVDIFSTEEWALEMIPQPVVAVLLLYPLTENQTQQCAEDVVAASDIMTHKVWFTKQRIGNACGTIGLLHALYNLPPALQERSIQPKSWLATFRQDCPIGLDPVAKAERLEHDPHIERMHDAATASTTNATDRGEVNDEVLTHFIALVCVENRLYELDGRKAGPIDHGPSSSATLLHDAITVVQHFMAKDPDELRFTMTALAPK